MSCTLRFELSTEHHQSSGASALANRPPTPYPCLMISDEPMSYKSPMLSTNASTISLFNCDSRESFEHYADTLTYPTKYHWTHHRSKPATYANRFSYYHRPPYRTSFLHFYYDDDNEEENHQQEVSSDVSLARKTSLRHAIALHNRQQEYATQRWNQKCWVVRAWLTATKKKPVILKRAVVQPVKEGERFPLDE